MILGRSADTYTSRYNACYSSAVARFEKAHGPRGPLRLGQGRTPILHNDKHGLVMFSLVTLSNASSALSLANGVGGVDVLHSRALQ